MRARVMKTALVLLLAALAIGALFVYGGNVLAQDPIEERFALLTRLGVRVQRTPPALPPPAGVKVSPDGKLTSRPPVLDDAALDRTARAELEKTPLPPRVQGPCQNDPELPAVIAGRKQVLKDLQLPPGATRFPATVTFRRPVNDAQIAKLVQDYHLTAANLTYVTNSSDSGGFGYGQDNIANTEQRLRSTYDSRLRVEGYTSVQVLGTPDDLRRLDVHADVLLVDPGKTIEVAGQQYKYASKFNQMLFWRYENACR